jgi:hypothetical protein
MSRPIVGSSQDSRLRGRMVAQIETFCRGLRTAFEQKPGALWLLPGMFPYRSGAGAGLDFEFNERRPRRKVAMETGPFRRRAVFSRVQMSIVREMLSQEWLASVVWAGIERSRGSASGDRLEGPLRPAIVLFLVRKLVESASCRRAPLSRQLRPAL